MPGVGTTPPETPEVASTRAYVVVSERTWEELGLPNSWPKDSTVVSFETRPTIIEVLHHSLSRMQTVMLNAPCADEMKDNKTKRRRLQRHDSMVGVVPVDVFKPGNCSHDRETGGLAAQLDTQACSMQACL